MQILKMLKEEMPQTIIKGENISYEVKAGIFKKLCEKAMGKENNNFNEKIEWLKVSLMKSLLRG